MKFVVSLVFFLFCSPAFAQKCSQVQVISPENTKSATQIFQAVRSQVLADPKLKNDFKLSEFVNAPPRDESSLLYLADISNNGERKYVFTSPGESSSAFINIYVFSKVGEKYLYLAAPPKPQGAHDGPWYFNWHRDPATKQIQFLVTGCNKIYMQFDLGPSNKLERYLWDDGATQKIPVD